MYKSSKLFMLAAFFLFIASVLSMFTGCASQRPGPVQYIEVPESYLQPCELPPLPKDNAEMSDAFAKSYKCGEQGNRDKERIREL